MKDVRLAIRFFWKWLPVNNLNIMLMGVAIVLLTVGGAVMFSREKFKKYGAIAGKVVLFLLLFYQVVYAITQYYDEHSPIGRIMPWNPSSISYYLMPIVAIFNVKPLKDTSYTLGLLAGIVMTFSTLVYSPMWIDFYQNSLTEYPFMQDMIVNARIATWNSISMHGALLVGGVWLVASGDFKYEPKNCKFFLLGLAVLLCYGMVGHHFFVPDKNVFFIFKNELPFEITHIDFRLDYCILLAALLWVIYYALPYAVKNIPLRIKQKKLIESYYGK